MKTSINEIIMVVKTTDFLHSIEAQQLSLFSQKLHNSITKALEKHMAIILKNNDKQYIVSFKTVTDAVLCSLKIQHKFKYSAPKLNQSIQDLRIAIANSEIDKDAAIKMATYLVDFVKNGITITKNIEIQYQQENEHIKIDRDRIRVITASEDKFLRKFMDYLNKNWKKNSLTQSDLQKSLQFSSSQIYYRVRAMSGKSPSRFITNFRLIKTLEAIHSHNGTLSSIAKNNGFGSYGYFSNCFKSRFGITPMRYASQVK